MKKDFIQQVRFAMIPGSGKRTQWLRKKKKFAMLGEHVLFQPRKYPLDGKRLKIHNNVCIAADVTFTLHDAIQFVYNYEDKTNDFEPYHGCIEIFDNCFIGANTRILPNVKIGPNAIVAAGSLVNKDVPEGTIVGGVPARVIGSYYELKNKRLKYSKEIKNIKASGYDVDEYLWQKFNEK